MAFGHGEDLDVGLSAPYLFERAKVMFPNLGWNKVPSREIYGWGEPLN